MNWLGQRIRKQRSFQSGLTSTRIHSGYATFSRGIQQVRRILKTLILWLNFISVERIVTPDQFAKVFCLDCDLPFDPWGLQIANAIRTQIDAYSSLAEVSVVPTDISEQESWEPDLRVIINVSLSLSGVAASQYTDAVVCIA